MGDKFKIILMGVNDLNISREYVSYICINILPINDDISSDKKMD